jgi:hypothetical protein
VQRVIANTDATAGLAGLLDGVVAGAASSEEMEEIRALRSGKTAHNQQGPGPEAGSHTGAGAGAAPAAAAHPPSPAALALSLSPLHPADRETQDVVNTVHARTPKHRLFAGLEKA